MKKVIIVVFFSFFYQMKIVGQHKYRIHSEMNLYSENSGFSHFDFAIAFYNGDVKMADYDPTWFNVEVNEISTQIEYSIFDLPMPVTSLVFYVQDYESGGDYDACLQYSEDLTPIILDVINPNCDHLLILQASEYCNEAFSGAGKLYKIESLSELNLNLTAKICEEKTLDIFESCNNVEYSLEAIIDGDINNPVLLLPYESHSGTYVFTPSDIPNVTDSSIIQFQVFYNEEKTESNTITYDVFPCVPVLDPDVPNNLIGLDVSCNGDADGGITAVFDRALTEEETMVLTFKIGDDAVHQTNPPLTQSDFEGNMLTYETEVGLSAGEYMMQWDVKIGNDVIGGDEAPVTITEPQPITFNLNKTDLTCSGVFDGEITIADLSGGNGNYTFDWKRDGGSFELPEGSTNTHLVNLPVGNYSLLVTDVLGCESEVQEMELMAFAESPQLDSYLIFQPGEPPNFLATGSIVLEQISGGDGNYVYNWTKDGEDFAPNDSIDLQDLESGEYTLVITDDGGQGCPSEEYMFTINELDPLEVSIAEDVSITCEGDIGILEADTVGGTNGGYKYLWSTGETTKSIKVGQGSYSVTVTDNANSVEEALHEFDYVNPLLTVEVAQNNSICKGEDFGSIQLNISGGTGGPYEVSWLDDPVTESFRENLSIGEYVYFVSDGECMVTNEDNPIVLTEPSVGIKVIEISKTNISINGAEDGTLTIKVQNGVPPFTYEWTKNGEPFLLSPESTNTELVGLGEGNYQVVVMDANSCSASLEQPAFIFEPEPLEIVALDPIHINCKGEASGAITANVTGIPPFNYVWEKQGEVNFSTASEPTITGLTAGTYTLRLTDNSIVSEVVDSVVLTEPSEVLVANVVPFSTVCFIGEEGTIDISAFGGTPPYIYSIDGGSSFQGGDTFSNLQADNYQVIIMDDNGCELLIKTTVGLPDQIKAEFAMASQSFVDENIIAVDLSYPLPDTVEWSVPEGAIVTERNNDELGITFTEPGEYEIGVTVYREDCWSTSTKRILVLENTLTGIINESEEVSREGIEHFVVYPNPTTGQFYADIGLSEIGNISLKVFGFANNNLMLQELAGGEHNYNIPMNIEGLPSGIYVVVLETPVGNSLRKLILR
ncbi:hypothetical protein KIM67_12030 [Flagellimonas sp. 389]|uniref:T9SS type A sorting domain-containing protein n=1 Tax=Flagellimonas sp. 389 TaxID=2835862 RepID=UPI001BD2CA04|nr:T9SS type A sorting domain-containing protein [Flagellimonas sp. 389]MBS9463141.1 hypothetical protein [Flagellimonas sp. 389]